PVNTGQRKREGFGIIKVKIPAVLSLATKLLHHVLVTGRDADISTAAFQFSYDLLAYRTAGT
ncbi:MAG TPA: hypothetical protein VM843_02755, partial [Flavisolibacter sp.]|nr:hypothetical protein [Flavisolibacter sp.]